MNREEIERIIDEAAQNERNKKKSINTDTVRTWLNALFLIAAVVGLVLYFAWPEKHIVGMAIVGGSMLLKVVEFMLRFLL